MVEGIVFFNYLAAHLKTKNAIMLYPRLGIQTAKSGGAFPLTANTVEICIKRM
jgi:hypothetical protein